MKVTREDFSRLVGRVMQDAGVANMRPVIEKELLHCDILFCLERANLLDNLVFQGGTSLRLCRGGNRFSEDLDFAGGRDFSSAMLAGMKDCIEGYIGSRYDLEVRVKEPAELEKDPKYAGLNIRKWQVSVITAPQRKDLPQQRIKIEVASVPAYTKEAVPLRTNYAFLPDGYDDTLIFAETLDEVMADKLISLPATQKYVRHRDVWDLGWLKQKGATVRPGLVRRKVEDYRLSGSTKMLDDMMGRLPGIIAGTEFKNEMRRFLPSDVYDRTLGEKKFEGFLTQTVVGLLKELEQGLHGVKAAEEFRM
ncbi:MAG: nucleotidyl transferase AbiEii/AbiGii toxin family protein [Gammaproteobacteria bacterium]|nr:nucleotidyl transferase AbiEii/AbiGii toxin family protein [Gammaproteobacteria bacterium]